MIDQFEIVNFQAHQLSNLEFDPGVNVIQGTSNSGKSSIIRALRWLILNQPRGDSFKRHDIKKTEDVAATIVKYDGTVVSRCRNSKVNEYFLEDTEKDSDLVFEALRSNVPEEISTALNLTALNIQSQFTPHFLLADTPGEVARTLNQYTGLEVIDRVLKAATGNLLKIGNTITTVTEQIEKQEQIVSDLKYVDALSVEKEKLKTAADRMDSITITTSKLLLQLAMLMTDENQIEKLKKITVNKNLITKAESLLDRHYQVINKRTALDNACATVVNLTEIMEKYKKQTKCKHEVGHASEMLEDLSNVKDELKEMREMLHELEVCELQKQRLLNITVNKKQVNAVVDMCVKCKRSSEDRGMINFTIDSLFNCEQQISSYQNTIKQIKTELDKIDICPLCGGDFKGDCL